MGKFFRIVLLFLLVFAVSCKDDNESQADLKSLNPSLLSNVYGDPASLTVSTVATETSLNPILNPSGITGSPRGGVYVASANPGITIYKITEGNVRVFYQDPKCPPRNTALIGMTVDQAGNLYVCDYKGVRIIKITPEGVASDFANLWRFDPPRDIAVSSDGTAYVSTAWSILKVSKTGVVSVLIGRKGRGYADGLCSNAKFESISGIALSKEGALYVAEFEGRIRMMSSQGQVTTVATSPAIENATDVLVDDKGTIFVLSWNEISRIDLDGKITRIAGVRGEPYENRDGPALQAKFKAASQFALIGDTLYFTNSRYGVMKLY